jgi:hypothetical protein
MGQGDPGRQYQALERPRESRRSVNSPFGEAETANVQGE